jgi:hypothetical protein
MNIVNIIYLVCSLVLIAASAWQIRSYFTIGHCTLPREWARPDSNPRAALYLWIGLALLGLFEIYRCFL